VTSDNDIAKTGIGMRRLLATAAVLVTILGLPLYFLPQNSNEFFSWSVRPALSAAFLGGAYLAAAVTELTAARQRIWANARIAVPAVLVFTLLTLIITLTNSDQYNYDAPGFVQSFGTWAWLAVYVVVPPIMVIILVVQLSRGGRDPIRSRPIPLPLRGVLYVGGMVLLLGGVILLIDPSTSSWMWPWSVSSLTARAFAAWMVGFGIEIMQVAWEADWIRARPATASAGVLGALQLIALIRYLDVPSWEAPQTWLYVAVLISFVVLGIWGWHATRDVTQDDSTPQRQAG
jgi:hypothetical protein